MWCITFASWCINRFLCEWGFFPKPIYPNSRQIWRLMFYIYYICRTKLQNHIILRTRKNTNWYMLEFYTFVPHTHHCFNTTWLTFYLMWDGGLGHNQETHRLMLIFFPKKVLKSNHHTFGTMCCDIKTFTWGSPTSC